MIDFNEMYWQFEMKYNKYPIPMSRAQAFGKALEDGLIDEDTYRMAREYFDKLWFYTGD